MEDDELDLAFGVLRDQCFEKARSDLNIMIEQGAGEHRV